jgi:hypothetical protein
MANLSLRLILKKAKDWEKANQRMEALFGGAVDEYLKAHREENAVRQDLLKQVRGLDLDAVKNIVIRRRLRELESHASNGGPEATAIALHNLKVAITDNQKKPQKKLGTRDVRRLADIKARLKAKKKEGLNVTESLEEIADEDEVEFKTLERYWYRNQTKKRRRKSRND